MRDVYITYGNLISSLGDSVETTFSAIEKGISGIRHKSDSGILNNRWPVGYIDGLFENGRFKILFRQITNSLLPKYGDIVLSDRTIVVVSSTKADVFNLPENPFESVSNIIEDVFKPKNQPIFISKACVSGISAINTASDLIKMGIYDNAIVIGIDVLSDFVINGFQSLFALSDEICRPFDKDRKGINLGEAGASIILSCKPIKDEFNVRHLSGSSSNDANHISGPSRTGEGLVRTIKKTINKSGIDKKDINFISSHGTATIYNDEMESICLDRLGMNKTPLNSMKGFFGHTLGAAGLIETIMSMKMMEHDLVIKSFGFSESGVSKSINILSENSNGSVDTVLKTGSGFGGVNASLIITKN